MAETQESGHIKVNAHEDEVVIYAGKQERAVSTMSAPSPSSPVRAVAEDDRAQDAPMRKASQQTSAQRADSYHATTLEDIRSSRMSTAQKAIIIVALLGLAAFIIWYAAFSG